MIRMCSCRMFRICYSCWMFLELTDVNMFDNVNMFLMLGNMRGDNECIPDEEMEQIFSSC